MQVNIQSQIEQKHNPRFGVSIKTNNKIDEWFVKRGIQNEMLDTFAKIIKENPSDERTFNFHGTYNPLKARDERWIYVSNEKNPKDLTGKVSLLIDEKTDISKTLKKILIDYKIVKILPSYIQEMGKKIGLNIRFDSSNSLYNPNGTLPSAKGYVKRIKEFAQMFSFVPEKNKYDIKISVLDTGMSQRVVVDATKEGKRLTSCLDDVVNFHKDAYPNLTQAIPELKDAKIKLEQIKATETSKKTLSDREKMNNYQEKLREITGKNNM